jgi:hypothetical protein
MPRPSSRLQGCSPLSRAAPDLRLPRRISEAGHQATGERAYLVAAGSTRFRILVTIVSRDAGECHIIPAVWAVLYTVAAGPRPVLPRVRHGIEFIAHGESSGKLRITGDDAARTIAEQAPLTSQTATMLVILPPSSMRTWARLPQRSVRESLTFTAASVMSLGWTALPVSLRLLIGIRAENSLDGVMFMLAGEDVR